MIEPRYVEWMNMEIDGVLSPEETSELHQYLTSNAEAAGYFESLKATLSAVAETTDPGPPPHLEDRILADGPWTQRHTRTAPGSIKGRFDKWFFTPALRYATVFCFGILFGVLVYSAINFNGSDAGEALDHSDLYGTMRKIDTAEGFRQTQDFKVDFEQARGRVSLYESENILLTEVVLNVPDAIRWTLQYDENDIVFEGYRRFENESGNIDVAPSVTTVSQTGDARYLLFFTRRDQTVDPMKLKVFSSDRLLLEESLVPSAAGQSPDH